MSDAWPDRAAPARGRQLLTSAVLLIGLIGLGLAARAALHDADDASLPGAVPLVVSLLLTRAALWCGARGWATLIGPGADRRLVIRALYESQLVKYLPAGGFIQAAGQVSMTAMHGVPLRRASLAFVALATSTVVAGLTIGTLLATNEHLPAVVRGVALLGLLMPLVMHRRTLALVLGKVRRISSRIPEAEDLPSERALWTTLGWTVANLALYAAAFTVLLRATQPGIPVLDATVGYVVAWVVGFLVLPVPSGVGIREAVLVALVPSVATGPLLAASLAQRLVAIASELLAAGGARLMTLRRGRP